MSNQEKRQQSVRASTGTAYSYNDDWMALFTAAGITSGTYNERLLVWINAQLSTAYTTLPDAMRAYAINQGVPSWNELGTFDAGGGSGPTGSGILLEDGVSFLLAETGDYLMLEQA
jgi:hypothetical protein